MTWTHWDDRYSEPGHAYGTEANDFLVQVTPHIPKGRILCLAEGQGRNAVHLATLGYEVVAVDGSAVGLTKAQELAASRGVSIDTVVADLSEYIITPRAWSGIVSIFCHLPSKLRASLHRAAVEGLRPGGVFVLEAYRTRQIALATGGPRDRDLLVSLDDLLVELDGLEFLFADEVERDVVEGRYHTGRAAVVQVAGRKPFA